MFCFSPQDQLKPILHFIVNKICVSLDSLLKPQCEIGGVADHAEQVRGVLLFVLFCPDAADQLGRPHSSVEDVGFYFSDRRMLHTIAGKRQSDPNPNTLIHWLRNVSLNCSLHPLLGHGDSPVELWLEQSQLTGDLNRMKGHEVEQVHLARSADVPLDERRRTLEGDAVANAIWLRLHLPLDDLIDGLNPLSHRLA